MWYFFPSEGGELIPWCPEVVLYIIQPEGGAASRPLDPVHRRAGPSLPVLVHAGARGLLRVRSGTYGACPLPQKVTEGRPIPDQ